MVKKLLKYDFYSFAKTILPMEIILLGIAVITRLIQFLDNGSTTYNIFNVSSIVLLCIAMVVCVVMTFFVCLVRFYKNLYTAQGYLTLTLPATHRAHIISKLITSVLATLISFISVIVAALIAMLGDTANEVFKAFAYIMKHYFKYTGGHGVFYIIEAIVALVAVIASGYLLFFACITIGQMAKKNRVLAAFGVFFIYYVIKQLLGTVLLVVYTFTKDYIPFDKIEQWISTHTLTFFHLLICGIIVFNAVLVIVYFAITKHIMKKKLNLE